MAKSEFRVSGMTCGHCEMAIRNEVSKIPGVTDLAVSAQTGKLSVSSDSPVPAPLVLAAVLQAGYSAEPVEA